MTNPTPLSPATQAVMDAVLQESNLSPTVRVAAAALRAVADQVVPEGYTQAYDCCLEIMGEIREDLLAIAAELEGTNNPSEND